MSSTVRLVPLIEEIFFHDDLEGHLRNWAGSLVGAGFLPHCMTAGPKAFVAGPIFSRVMPLLTHATANLIIFAAAFALGRMYII